MYSLLFIIHFLPCIELFRNILTVWWNSCWSFEGLKKCFRFELRAVPGSSVISATEEFYNAKRSPLASDSVRSHEVKPLRLKFSMPDICFYEGFFPSFIYRFAWFSEILVHRLKCSYDTFYWRWVVSPEGRNYINSVYSLSDACLTNYWALKLDLIISAAWLYYLVCKSVLDWFKTSSKVLCTD